MNLIFFLDYSYCHILSCTSYFGNNERLLRIFGSRLLASALNRRPFFLAGLFFKMLFMYMKQIINVLRSSWLHWPVGLLVSIIIDSKITSLSNLLEIRKANVFFCVSSFIVVSKIRHLFEN